MKHGNSYLSIAATEATAKSAPRKPSVPVTIFNPVPISDVRTCGVIPVTVSTALPTALTTSGTTLLIIAPEKPEQLTL